MAMTPVEKRDELVARGVKSVLVIAGVWTLYAQLLVYSGCSFLEYIGWAWSALLPSVVLVSTGRMTSAGSLASLTRSAPPSVCAAT